MFKLVVLLALAVVAVPGVTGALVRCDGSLDAAVERVRACASAADALGADIGPSFVGLSCGSSRTEGAFGQASWETPVAGTRGRGTLRYAAEKRGEAWQVLSASVEVGGATLPVVPCGGGGGPDGASTDTVACDGGDGAACNRLGVAAARGEGGAPKNLETARSLYERACEGGDPTGCANLGALHERDFRDDSAAAHYYRLGCDRGSPAACTGLAGLLESGRGLKADQARARVLLDDACGRGHAAACGRLGALLAAAAPPDPRARELLERGCAADDPASCAELGALHAEGRGGPKDEPRAIQLWLGLCDRGEAVGCARLGRHYQAKKEPDEAKRYLQRACAAGDRAACETAEKRR